MTAVYLSTFCFSIFLKIDSLQEDVIQIISENITADLMEPTEDTSWLRTLLKPLTCLPTIKNGESLAKSLLDFLQIASFPCQLEILEVIPEIIPDDQCDYAADHLTKLLDNNEELCGAIVNCLTALNLSADIKMQIHDRILARMFAGASLRVYLIFVRFLISDFRSPTIVTTLLKIRNSLDNMVSNTSKEKESDKTLIFNYIQTSALTQKVVTEGWLNTIANCKSAIDHKPIDLLIIIMLHHNTDMRKRHIQMIFRKRVGLGLFKVGLLEKAFEKYMTQQFIKDYMSDIIEIGCYLIRFSKDTIIAKFATTLFEHLFNHQYTSAIYRAEILSNLICLTGSNDHCTINTVLQLILTLVHADCQKVQTHIILLMQLLEKLDMLELKDVKTVFDILCSLLCGQRSQDALSGFRDQLFNTVRKQLSRCERVIKHRGIISAIVMVKHTIYVDNDDADVLDVTDLPKEQCLKSNASREGVELLELVQCATGDNPDLLCLYYDQLASILAGDQLFDKYFLYWLYKSVEEDFEKTFLSSTVPKPTNDLTFTIQYELNSPDETTDVFAINIGGFTVCGKNDKILLLSPYFRVLRLLHFRQHGHLSHIDSLLGCGVILPEAEDPKDLDADQISQVVDCLFHCINWFREIINAFVTQKDQLLQQRVVRRLSDLIEVETKLYSFLMQVPSHNLPLSYFDSVKNVTKQVTKVTKNPKKKFKSTAVVVDETCNTTVNTQATNKPTKKLPSVQIGGIQFREMDTDIIKLIKYPLTFEEDRTKTTLNLSQVKFILNDFIYKLETLTQNKTDSRLCHLNDVKPEHLIKDCTYIIRYVNNFLEIIVKKLDEIIEEGEEAHYTDEANEVKSCFSNILQIFNLIFQWPGFQHTGNMDVLRDILKSTRQTGSQTLASANRLIVDFVQKISSFKDHCLHLSHAVTLVNIVNVLHNLTVPTTEIKRKLTSLAEGFLSKRWYDNSGKSDHGMQCNRNIDFLVKTYLKDSKTDALAELVDEVIADLQSLESKNGCLTKFPAIDRKNFHVFYLELCNALLSAIRTEIQSLTNIEHISLWLTVAATLTSLMNIAKQLNYKNNMACFLKKTIGILKIFLISGLPMMEIMMKTNTDAVYKVLRTIQTTTRFLHHLCCQSKLTKDTTIVAHIPSFKQTIESIIYRVKAALVANNCSSAFWLGVLRNKDIDGEEIQSQSTVVSSNDDQMEVDNDQLPSDDDDDGNIINDSRNSDNESVESEAFG